MIMRTNKFLACLLTAFSILLNASCSFAGGFIGVRGSEFAYEGQTFQFTGMNISGLSHYGHGAPFQYSAAQDIDANIAGVAGIGGKVIRIFAVHQDATAQECVDRLKIVLDKMQAQGMFAIVVFTDLYGSYFHPKGDGGYYQQVGDFILLNDAWFTEGYKTNYLPWVQLAVTQLKDHPAVFCWEIGNELKDPQVALNIVQFVAEMAATIKNIDHNHLVTPGFLSWDHQGLWMEKGLEVYSDPNIDFITIHSYDGSDGPQNRIIHSRLGKPLLLEECGWREALGNRIDNEKKTFQQYGDVGARGFMHWGYQAQDHDIGNGDNLFGIDSYHWNDYADFTALYASKSAELTALSQPVRRVSPVGKNVASSITASKTDSASGPLTGVKAYDGIIAPDSIWSSASTGLPHYLALDLGQSRRIDGVTLRMAGFVQLDGMVHVDYNLKRVELQSGESLDGPWTTEEVGLNPAQFSFLNILMPNGKSTRYLRLLITDSGPAGPTARIAEVEVYETVQARAMEWELYG